MLTPQRKTSCHIFKMAIFSKFFVDVMTHIIRDNAAKRIKLFFELFINKNYEFIFVSFSSSHTLRTKEDREVWIFVRVFENPLLLIIHCTCVLTFKGCHIHNCPSILPAILQYIPKVPMSNSVKTYFPFPRA